MKTVTYTTIDGRPILILTFPDNNGGEHPDGVGPDVVTTPEQSFDHARGRVETKNTRYTKAAAPSKLYKPTHGGYPG